MKNIVYDNGFNLNEWLVIAMIIGGIVLILKLKKIFTPTEVLYTLMFGVTTGLMFDHTIAVPPFDYYDIGDQSNYQYFDIFSYLMYSPFGYFFMYFYFRYNIKGFKTIIYIAFWTALGIGIEYIGNRVGIFHYKHGYNILYSIPIYLITQSLFLYLYLSLFENKKVYLKRV